MIRMIRVCRTTTLTTLVLARVVEVEKRTASVYNLGVHNIITNEEDASTSLDRFTASY